MISLILLASGFGRRFGSNKLLYEFDGKPMYFHTLEKIHRLSRLNVKDHSMQVIVISQYEEILQQAEKMGAIAIHNPDANEGIAASVRMGCEAAQESDYYVYFMADQPYIREETIIGFLEAFLDSQQSMGSVYSKNEPGNPTIFHRRYGEELRKLKGDVGGRRIMKKYPEEVFWYEISALEKKDIDFSPERPIQG